MCVCVCVHGPLSDLMYCQRFCAVEIFLMFELPFKRCALVRSYIHMYSSPTPIYTLTPHRFTFTVISCIFCRVFMARHVIFQRMRSTVLCLFYVTNRCSLGNVHRIVFQRLQFNGCIHMSTSHLENILPLRRVLF